jgi:hypothetical protein
MAEKAEDAALREKKRTVIRNTNLLQPVTPKHEVGFCIAGIMEVKLFNNGKICKADKVGASLDP